MVIKAAKGIKSHTSFKGKHKVSGLTHTLVRLAYNRHFRKSPDNFFLKLCCDVRGQRSSKRRQTFSNSAKVIK